MQESIILTGNVEFAAMSTTWRERACTVTFITLNELTDRFWKSIQSGLVARLNRPEGNLTGISFFSSQMESKRLDDRFHETGCDGTGDSLVDSSFVLDQTRSSNMAGWRQAVELAMTDDEIEELTAIAHSRTEAARRVERAQMLLAYRETPSFFAVGILDGHQDADPRT